MPDVVGITRLRIASSEPSALCSSKNQTFWAQRVFRGDFQYSFPGVVRLFQGCNMYRCKEGINVDSYRTHKR